MANDIENAVRNHDDITFTVRRLTDRLNEIGKERGQFMLAQDKIRGQIKDFENFLNETRGVNDRSFVDFKREIHAKIDTSLNEVRELGIDRRQLKAMVKNQNYHFTELQKEIGVLKSRMTQAEKICDEVPGLITYSEVTDTYL